MYLTYTQDFVSTSKSWLEYKFFTFFVQTILNMLIVNENTNTNLKIIINNSAAIDALRYTID